MALFEPARHEPLVDDPWDERRARAALAAIVADAQRAFAGVDGLWPIHPLDRSPERPDVLTPLYYGAAGVIWALHHLDAGGDFRRALAALPEHTASFGMGRSGILLLRWQLDPSAELERALHDAIDSHLEHPSLGLLWGGPGTMLAALFMLERTGGSRWLELYLRGADALWRAWRRDDTLGCHLWTQDLYGHRDQQLGALHGFAGNAFALLRGQHLLSEARRAELSSRVIATLRATALREGGFANWPMCAGATGRPGAESLRVQHCTGAPGIVSSLALLPREAEVDALLVAAGELVWAAGPPAKLPSLCHGAPGSGYAFLKLHRRTGNPLWLERARRFAMHAIAQSERALREHGQRKYSLWTGDLGLAVYLHSCIAADDAFPTLDVF